jgi:hypothetical protein
MMNRKPDGRSRLNRLSKDRQAAIADYAARHTLLETVQWLKHPDCSPEPCAPSNAGAGPAPSPAPQPQKTPVSRWALARRLPNRKPGNSSALAASIKSPRRPPKHRLKLACERICAQMRANVPRKKTGELRIEKWPSVIEE